MIDDNQTMTDEQLFLNDGIQVTVNEDEENAFNSDYSISDEESDKGNLTVISGDNMDQMEETETVVEPHNVTPNKQSDEFAKYRNDPHLARWVSHLLDERIKAVQSKLLTEKNQGKSLVKVTPKGGRENISNNTNVTKLDNVKSPSDTTLYKPALKRRSVINQTDEVKRLSKGDDKLINHISDFVAGIRMEQENKEVNADVSDEIGQIQQELVEQVDQDLVDAQR